MIITIVRHGQAGDAACDESRELTTTGTDDVSFGCHQLHDLCSDKSLLMPQHILHSSWRRTTQTAEILAAAFTIPVVAFDALLPGGGVGDVDKALTQLNARNNSIGHSVLVGHQPMVSELVDCYLGDHGKVPSLPPGGFVTMSLHVHARGCGELLFWAFPPEYRGFV